MSRRVWAVNVPTLIALNKDFVTVCIAQYTRASAFMLAPVG